MAETIYFLCAISAFVCAWLLLQAYYDTRYKLLLWSGLCFSVLTVNNIMLVLDDVFMPSMDLSMERLITALVAMLIMLYGLIWETE